MAIEITPLGFKAPDGNEPARNGDNVIADNARKAQELIAGVQSNQTALQQAQAAALAQAEADRAELAALRAAQTALLTADFDGGTPSTAYVAVQTIDGGTV